MKLLTDFVCLYNYEFWLSLCKIVRSSVILLLPLFINTRVILFWSMRDIAKNYAIEFRQEGQWPFCGVWNAMYSRTKYLLQSYEKNWQGMADYMLIV
jgi:prepilin signal peptidase PulO-like enzyme (type II secretory pathway)